MANPVVYTPTSEHIRKFLNHFEKLRYRRNGFTAFSDFLALSALDISNAVNPNKDRYEQYQKLLNKYNAEEQNAMAEMLSAIILEMSPPKGTKPRYYDVLGELFSNLELKDDYKAQFFTPQFVSDMCGIMTFGEKIEPAIQKRGYVKLHEPCIGGGSMVTSVINTMFQRGYNPCKQLLVVAYDLDIHCIYMSYIQLSLMGVPAILQQRDSLTLKAYGDYWFTPVFVLDDWAGRLKHERLMQKVRNIFSEIEKAVPAEFAKVETPRRKLRRRNKTPLQTQKSYRKQY